MELKFLSLNVRGLNKTTKQRQLFRWLHQETSDVIFLQETYSSVQTVKLWEAEWGGKMLAWHGSTHTRGVMILFKLKINVSIGNVIRAKKGRYIVSETAIDDVKCILVNIYAPNGQT